ncbi:AbgT transporter [Caballeronia hypogeia]|uniref:AbgT transporter n=1 Tax=Caballeronia hypogeia TaxID=1777140 RepID=A0A158AAJ5_9BURK|nr:DUF3100 domain-containing protein [Caballeronia hypogeia]SAK54854.1 AbgT transporter [Caballeronia hypogeia]
MTTETLTSVPTRTALSGYAKLYLYALVIIVVAGLIGSVSFKLGPGKVVLLPMVWAILMGAAVGLARPYMPGPLKLDTALQFKSAAVLQAGLMLFIAKLGLLVGNSLPEIARAGWSLGFQELGHFVGTILMGLPIALLLGIKREAIGATFSVGREPSLAIIGEKYGMDSPEGRGVLAEYLTGTVFGAVFIAIFAGLVTSLNIFDPIALAMGAGVGSGSMMAAAAGAIAAQQSPEVAKTVATFAAASNLITSVVGTYFTLFISLPLAVRGYKVMEPILGRTTKASAPATGPASEAVGESHSELSGMERWGAWLVVAALSLVSDLLLYKTSPLVALPGMAIIVACVAVGQFLSSVTGRKVPAVCWISLIAMFLTSPACPWAAQMIAITGKVNFLASTPPMLTFAGLSIAKDVPAFRQLGWRIVLVSLIANAGTFLGATFIAQVFHH